MKILKIGIVHSDQKGQDTIANAFEDILLDEICTKTLYEKQGEEGIALTYRSISRWMVAVSLLRRTNVVLASRCRVVRQ